MESLELANTFFDGVSQVSEDTAICCIDYGGDDYYSRGSEELLNRIIDEGLVRIIYDCSGMVHITSVHIGFFCYTLKELEKRMGGRLLLCSVPEEVMLPMKQLGFASYFEYFQSVADAMKAL